MDESYYLSPSKNSESTKIKTEIAAIDVKLCELEQGIQKTLHSMQEILFSSQEKSIH